MKPELQRYNKMNNFALKEGLLLFVWCSVFGVQCSVLDGLPALGEVRFVAGGPTLLPAPDGSGSGRADPCFGGRPGANILEECIDVDCDRRRLG
jgi:hypothetical protein